MSYIKLVTRNIQLQVDGDVAGQRLHVLVISRSIMADNVHEFQLFLANLPYERLVENAFTEDLQIADRMCSAAQGTCSGCVLFCRIFETQNYGDEALLRSRIDGVITAAC